MSLPNILIVDDKEFDRILYKEYLDDSNYNFNELDDGDLVIDYLKETIPDILLLDWQMPRLGGLDVLKLIKKNKNFQNIPIIIITGLADEKVLEEAFDYGSVDFLNKPVSKVELNARVMNALNLMEANQALFKQKEELVELNKIIKSQKIELEKSLELKSEQLETNEKEFEKGINEKSKKLITMEMDSSRLSNNLKSVITQVKEATTKLKTENAQSSVLRSLKSIERTLEGLTSHDNNWDDFKLAFEQIDADFFNNLSKVNPRLTSLDLKHCAYIKMNLDNYEVSRILNVEMKSLQMTRYRLKKKLKLDENTLLREYIHSV